jgi:hypothetical protein
MSISSPSYTHAQEIKGSEEIMTEEWNEKNLGQPPLNLHILQPLLKQGNERTRGNLGIVDPALVNQALVAEGKGRVHKS